MKEPNQHIDKIFRDLKEGNFEIPNSFLDDLNNRLDAELPLVTSKKKRKFPFWILLILPVLTLLIYVGIREMRTEKANHKTATKESFSSKEANKNRAKKLVKTSKNQAGDSKTHSKSDSKISKSKNETKFILNVKTENNSHELANALEAKTTLAKQQQSKQVTTSKTKKRNEKTTQAAKVFDSKDLTALNEAETTSHSDFNQTTGKALQFLTLIALKPITVASDSMPDLISNSFQPVPNQDSKISNARNWEYDIQLYGGVSNSSWKRSGLINSSLENKFTFSNSFGLKSNVYYKNSTFGLGLELDQTKEKISYETAIYQQVGTETFSVGFQIDTVFIDSTFYLDSTEIFQTTPIYDSVDQKNTLQNHYAWLSIPMTFGYRFSFSKWDLIPRVGLNFNLGVSQNTGSYPNSTGILQKQEAVRFYLDYSIQTEIRRNINQFHLFLVLYYRGNLNPMLKTTDFKIDHSAWGINFGIGIML